MNETLIHNWNSVVKPNDTVWHLGDFGFANINRLKEILRRLNGDKNFVYGNHDKQLRANYKSILEEGLFNKMVEDYELKWDGKLTVLHHYGKRVWNKSHHGSYHLFGHSHGHLEPHGRSVDVGSDAAWITGKPTYTPYSFEQIDRYLQSRPVMIHHRDD